MEEPLYDVFVRKERGEPLRRIGSLNAFNDQMARVYAWRTYDEERWFEMCVIPRSAIISVNRREGPPGAKAKST